MNIVEDSVKQLKEYTVKSKGQLEELKNISNELNNTDVDVRAQVQKLTNLLVKRQEHEVEQMEKSLKQIEEMSKGFEQFTKAFKKPKKVK